MNLRVLGAASNAWAAGAVEDASLTQLKSHAEWPWPKHEQDNTA
jgi:hypothetical protein